MKPDTHCEHRKQHFTRRDAEETRVTKTYYIFLSVVTFAIDAVRRFETKTKLPISSTVLAMKVYSYVLNRYFSISNITIIFKRTR